MATTSLFNGTAPNEVGSDTGGTANNASGNIVYAVVKDGIDGTVEAFFDARLQPVGSTTWLDSAGNTWTLHGNSIVEQGATFTTPVRRYTSRRGNIAEYDDHGVERPTTGLAVVGDGEGEVLALFFLSATQGDIPLWEDKYTVKDVGDDGLLISQGNQELARSAGRAKTFTLEMDPNQEPYHSDVYPGQRVRLVIHDGYVQVDEEFWIGRKRVTLTKEQTPKLTLEVTQ